MPGPWERYQQQPAESAKPWERYQKSRPFVGPLEEKPFVGPMQEPGYLSRAGKAYGNFVRELGNTARTKPWEIPGAIRDTMGSMAIGMVTGPANDFLNAGAEALEMPTKEDIIPTYQPRSDLGRAATAGISEVMSPISRAVDSQYVTDINNEDPAKRATGRLIRGALGVLPLVGARGLPKGEKPPPKPTPKTAAQLRTEANAAYARADDLSKGEIVRQESLGNLTNRIEKVLTDEAADFELEPMTGYAYNKLLEESTKPGTVGHSPQGLEILRRKLLKAEGNAARAGNAGDARQVARIIDDFDEWADNLVEGRDVLTSGARTQEAMAARTEARQLWATMKRTSTIEDLVERAKSSAPALSQTGFENALRIEFKNLSRNERRMRQFNTEERAAIQRVARGGVAQWAARRVASLAPRGVVSGAGATVIGGATGAGAIPVMAVGEAGALAARLMRLRDVEAARTLISNGRNAAQATQAPGFAGPTAATVRASTAVPPALAAEEIDRQRRNYLAGSRPRNSLKR